MDVKSEREPCSREGVSPVEEASDVASPEIEKVEEMRQPTAPARPTAPTKAELKDHYPLHLNY